MAQGWVWMRQLVNLKCFWSIGRRLFFQVCLNVFSIILSLSVAGCGSALVDGLDTVGPLGQDTLNHVLLLRIVFEESSLDGQGKRASVCSVG